MFSEIIEFTTEKRFIDITDAVQKSVTKSKVISGLVNVFVRHTTCGVKILENEILSFVDISNFLERVVPDAVQYQHDRIELRAVPPAERINGSSHVKMLFFPTSETIPIFSGKLMLGEWQRICLIEMDYGQPFRKRDILITITEGCSCKQNKQVYCD